MDEEHSPGPDGRASHPSPSDPSLAPPASPPVRSPTAHSPPNPSSPAPRSPDARARGPVRRLFRLGLNRPGVAEEVAWEVEHYLQERRDQLIEEGWDPEAAAAEAERRFGATRRRERRLTLMGWWERAMRTAELFREAIAATLRDLLRGTRRAPGFALGVVAIMGLGVGANASMFTIVDRLLLQPPPHLRAPDQLHLIGLTRASRPTSIQYVLPYPDFMDLRSRGTVPVATFASRSDVTLGRGEDARSLRARQVSHEYFDVLGTPLALGRDFVPEEDRVGVHGTAVMSHELWRRAWGADPGVLGREIELSGETYTVIGVAPRGFTGLTLEPTDVWVPIETRESQESAGNLSFRTSRGSSWIRLVARLDSTATPDAVAARATAIFRAAGGDEATRQTREERGSTLLLTPLAAMSKGPEANVATWLLGVALAVLLVACANVANLLLARTVHREREVAVRLALGASRTQVMLLQGTEAVLLAALGGAAALALSTWAVPALTGILLPEIVLPSVLNPRVLAFTTGMALLAGVLAGLGPALQASRGRLAGLDKGSRGSTRPTSMARSSLTIVQAGLSVVLLVGAGLFVRSVHEVERLDLGLEVDGLYLAELEFTVPGVTIAPRDQNRAHAAAAEVVARLPGVASAGVTHAPFGWGFAGSVRVPGVDSIGSMPGGGPYYYAVDAGYFDALGLDVLAGRSIEQADGEASERVAVVSRSMADSIWDGAALGGCLLLGRDAQACTTVVGVVEDAVRVGLLDEPYHAYYVPIEQGDFRAQGIYVRAAPGSTDVGRRVATALRTYSPDVRFARVRSMEEILDPDARSWKLGASMFTLFGVLALLVSSVGLYSLLAFGVAERTRELGIRRALGAGQGKVLGSVIGRGLRLVAAGVALGLLAAWVAAPFAEDLLFRVSPRDARVLAGVASVVLTVSLVASLGPALRATRADPLAALRAE